MTRGAGNPLPKNTRRPAGITRSRGSSHRSIRPLMLRRTLLQSLPAVLGLFGSGKRASDHGWRVLLQSVAGASRLALSKEKESGTKRRNHHSIGQASVRFGEPASQTGPPGEPDASASKTLRGESDRRSARKPRPENPDRLSDTGSTPSWLEEWLSRPIQPVLDHLDMTGRIHEEIINWAHLRKAMHRRSSLTIHYHGGTEPGRLRRITPALVFHKLDDDGIPPLYVLAWCHLRKEHRTFRLDRMRCL